MVTNTQQMFIIIAHVKAGAQGWHGGTTCNLGTQKAEAGGLLWVWGQPGLYELQANQDYTLRCGRKSTAAQLVKHFPWKHEDLSSILQNLFMKKLNTVTCMYNPRAGEEETGRSWGLTGQSPYPQNQRKSHRQGEWKRKGCTEMKNVYHLKPVFMRWGDEANDSRLLKQYF